MQQSSYIFTFVEHRHNFVNGQPLSVLMASDDRKDFLVDFYELVVAMAASDSCQKGTADLLFFTFVQFLSLGDPSDLDCVLELDEGGLFDVNGKITIIDDLHHRHAET